MKKANVLFGLLMLCTAAIAQQEIKPAVKISEKAMKALGVPLVNQFQLAVKKLKDCPCFILDGTKELFTENAKIEVSSINSKTIRKYTPESYFRTVNALRCGGKNAIYRSMRFDYEPVSDEDATVSYFEGSCTVSYTVKQSFIGISSRGKKDYSDYTIKLIIINFIKDAKGELKPKIIGVIVEETHPLKENAQTNDPS